MVDGVVDNVDEAVLADDDEDVELADTTVPTGVRSPAW